MQCFSLGFGTGEGWTSLAFSLIHVDLPSPYCFRRLLKEANHYKAELATNQSRMDELVATKSDAYDVKLFQQVLDESRMMVPDSEKRFAAALEELQEFVDDNNALEGEWMETATSFLAGHGKKGDLEGSSAPRTSVDDLAEGEAF
jgi:hypothetical protein